MQMSKIRLPLAPVLATLLGGLSPLAVPPATAQTSSPVVPTKTYELKPIKVRVNEGEKATLTLELSENAPDGGLVFIVKGQYSNDGNYVRGDLIMEDFHEDLMEDGSSNYLYGAFVAKEVSH